MLVESDSVSRSVVYNSWRPHGLDGLSGSSVHGILQVRVLEWVAIPFSRGSSWPKDWIWVLCIAGRSFTIWATREAQTAAIQENLDNQPEEIIEGNIDINEQSGYDKKM